MQIMVLHEVMAKKVILLKVIKFDAARGKWT